MPATCWRSTACGFSPSNADGAWIRRRHHQIIVGAQVRDTDRRFTETEARRIKTFLGLPERPGLDGLEQALAFRFAALANRRTECRRAGDALEFRVVDCRVQSARTRRGLPLHPCKPVGENEYAYFARVIDDRIGCEAVSCFPDMTEPDCACAWRFRLEKE